MKLFISSIVTLAIILVANSYRIPLPPGKTMESVSHLSGSNFILSDTITGNVMMTDIVTRQVFTIVQAPANRSIQGLVYDKTRGLIITAGSGTGYTGLRNRQLAATNNVLNLRFPEPINSAFYFYKLTTGEPAGSCVIDGGGIINDLEIDEKAEFAYFTDSTYPVFYRLDMKDLSACKITRYALPESDFSGAGFYSAGIALYGDGVVISSFIPATIWYYNLKTMKAQRIVEANFGGMDGIRVLRGKCLLGASNDAKVINVFRISTNPKTGKVKTKFVRALGNPSFTEVTGIAIRGRTMVVTNNDMTLLGNTGQLWTSVTRIPPFWNLC